MGEEDQTRMSLETTAERIMTWDVKAVEMGTRTTVREAARLMARTGHGCLIVTKGTNAMGIVTERDIVHKVTAEGFDPSKVLIEDIMTSPLITIGSGASIKEVAEKMSAFEIRRTVVVDETGKLVGLITSGDLAKWFARLREFKDPAFNAIARVKESGPYS